jgi:hypothetical protein
MRKIMTPARSACFALAIASIAGATPGIAQDAPKFDCARLAPLVQRHAREMSTLLPDIENTEVQTTLKGKASGELAGTIAAYTQARQALLKPLRVSISLPKIAGGRTWSMRRTCERNVTSWSM